MAYEEAEYKNIDPITMHFRIQRLIGKELQNMVC